MSPKAASMSLLSNVILLSCALVSANARSLDELERRGSTKSVLDLHRTTRYAPSSNALHTARTDRATPVIPIESGSGYAVEVYFGGHPFLVRFDTGSSDLWIPRSTFQCISPGIQLLPQSACGFADTFPGYFSEGRITNENFHVSYGSGEIIIGDLGYETVTLAGITVPRQESALASFGFWEGDGRTSGIMGFAYPFLTSAYEGATPGISQKPALYKPFLFNAIQQGSCEDYFSLALARERDGGVGQLAIGGIPNINLNGSSFGSTPLRSLAVQPGAYAPTNQYSYYTIVPDDILVRGQRSAARKHKRSHTHGRRAQPLSNESSGERFPVVIDSGTTLMYLPNELAEEVNRAFDPPAQYNSQLGVYEAPCNASPPEFAIQIGGRPFVVDAEDMLHNGFDSSTNRCVTGVQPTEPPYILGDTFLRNVLAVFDIGKSEMHFAQR